MAPEHEVAEAEQRTQSKLMYILSQLRIKITLPYILLAIIVTFAAAFLVTRLLSGLLENRFQSTLLDAGRKAADSMVSLEEEHLAAWRSIAYIEGMDKAVAALDGEAIGRSGDTTDNQRATGCSGSVGPGRGCALCDVPHAGRNSHRLYLRAGFRIRRLAQRAARPG
jgi:hypothetical protein